MLYEVITGLTESGQQTGGPTARFHRSAIDARHPDLAAAKLDPIGRPDDLLVKHDTRDTSLFDFRMNDKFIVSYNFV